MLEECLSTTFFLASSQLTGDYFLLVPGGSTESRILPVTESPISTSTQVVTENMPDLALLLNLICSPQQ